MRMNIALHEADIHAWYGISDEVRFWMHRVISYDEAHSYDISQLYEHDDSDGI